MPELDPFFAELEAEIAAAGAKSQLKSDAAALKRTANNMRLDIHTRARAAEEFRRVQAIVEAEMWEPIRSGALFTEQSCDGCGSVHYNFLQFMQEEHKIRQPTTKRWVRVPRPNGDLPTDTILQPLATHMCSDCCGDHGFDVGAPTIKLLPREEALTVSGTYLQEDINDPQT